jgi:hypothetical protein
VALDIEWEKIPQLEQRVTYEQLGQEIGRLVATKQKQYGDAFGRSGAVLRILYPDGIRPDQYDDALAVTRIVDKLFRIANGSQGEESPGKDICGYGLLMWARQEGVERPGTYTQADLDAADARAEARLLKLVVIS